MFNKHLYIFKESILYKIDDCSGSNNILIEQKPLATIKSIVIKNCYIKNLFVLYIL